MFRDYSTVADRYITSDGHAPAYEPGPADYAEMQSSFLLHEVTEWCRTYRGRRDQLKEQLNQVFQGHRIGLKVIRWSAWQ